MIFKHLSKKADIKKTTLTTKPTISTA